MRTTKPINIQVSPWARDAFDAMSSGFDLSKRGFFEKMLCDYPSLWLMWAEPEIETLRESNACRVIASAGSNEYREACKEYDDIEKLSKYAGIHRAALAQIYKATGGRLGRP